MTTISRDSKLPFFILTLLCAVIYFSGLFVLPVTNRDEARFAQASKQMLQSHNYVEINFQDKPRHLKPPGIYWLQALSVKLFSAKVLNRIWAYRLPSLLGAWLSVLLLFGLSRRWVGNHCAFFAAAVLAASPLLVIMGHLATTDAAQLVAMVLMQFGLMRLYLTDHAKKSNYNWLLFWLGMALGVLIKGITPLIGLLTLFTLCIIDRKSGLWRNVKFFRGVAIVLLLTLAWLIPFSLAGKSNFLWDMIHGDVLPKLAHGQQTHGAPPGYYLIIYFVCFFPFCLATTAMIIHAINYRRQAIVKFLLAWIIPNWLIYAIIVTKMPEYILPLFPALALLMVMSLREHLIVSKLWRIVFIINSLLWAVAEIIISFAPIWLNHFMQHRVNVITWIFAVISLVLCVVIATLFIQRRFKSFIILSIASNTLLFVLLLQFILPAMDNLWLTEKINVLLKQHTIQLTAQRPLLVNGSNRGYGEPSLVFRIGTDKIKNVTLQQLIDAFKHKSNQVALLSQKSLKTLSARGVNYTIVDCKKGFRYNGGYFVTICLLKN
ncbi:MAG: glycosyltransferase family 39 protein [Pseudomonadota bacterium]